MRPGPFLLALCLFGDTVAAAEVLHMDVQRDGNRYRIGAVMLVAVNAATVHALLTDYPGLPRLNPAIKKSEILAVTDAAHQRVRTTIRGCVLFFCRTLVQVQDLTQLDDGQILAVIVPEGSDFRFGEFRWRPEPYGAATRLRFEAQVEPAFWVPPLIGPMLVKRKLRQEAEETAAGLEAVAAVSPAIIP